MNPNSLTDDQHVQRGANSSSETGSPPPLRARPVAHDWLPDWAPWAVLGTLVCVGVLGGLGFAPMVRSGPSKPHEDPVSHATSPSRAVAHVTTPARPAPSATATRNEERISVRHLVVSHKDSPLGARHAITRTKAEARTRAIEAALRARKGEPFEKLIAEYSDEPGAKERQGELRKFGRRHAIPGFAEAAFALEPGELSGVVETKFGYHVILRTE